MADKDPKTMKEETTEDKMKKRVRMKLKKIGLCKKPNISLKENPLTGTWGRRQ